MERWVVYAFVSMLFAGFTSVIAKQGLAGISSELGLAVRTLFVAVFVLGFAAFMVRRAEIGSLTRANVGIAMGVAGSDVALESADLALMRDDLSATARLFDLSRRTVAIIRQNVTLSLVTKLLALLLGVFGFVNLWIAVLADVGTSIVVTLNGLRLARLERDRPIPMAAQQGDEAPADHPMAAD